MISDALLIAVAFNLTLLVISYYAGYRALLITSSIIWVIIDLLIYQELEDVLILAIIFMIAAAQTVLPLRGERSPLSRR